MDVYSRALTLNVSAVSDSQTSEEEHQKGGFTPNKEQRPGIISGKFQQSLMSLLVLPQHKYPLGFLNQQPFGKGLYTGPHPSLITSLFLSRSCKAKILVEDGDVPCWDGTAFWWGDRVRV